MFEFYIDVIVFGDKVLLVDDLFVIGGIIEVIVKLVVKLGGNVMDVVFVVFLFEFGGE